MRKLIPVFHGFILIASLFSPLWADWKIIVLGYILYIAQKLIFKGCVLSFAEFGSVNKKPRQHFTPYYLKKIFKLEASEHTIIRNLDYIVAPLVPIIAIFIQLVLNYRPLILI